MGFHFARPGPGYWDFRCLRCDEPVRGHLRRQLRRLHEEGKT